MIPTLKKEHWFHPDGFPIAIERRDPQEPFGLHAHEFFELVIITGGRGLHLTGTDSWTLSAGDVFVLGGARPHDYRNMEELRLINVLFDLDKLQMKTADLHKLPGYHVLFTLEPAWRERHQFKSRLHLSPKDLGIVSGLIDQLDQELKERQTGFGFMAISVFMQLIGFLSRCYGQTQNPDSRALLRLAETITHLESRYPTEITLEELANIAHMSKRSFIRTFEAAMGMPPITYLIHLRIQHAARLLLQSDENITTIAIQTGFNDSNYFSRQFRKVTGLSPRAFRQKNRSGPIPPEANRTGHYFQTPPKQS